MSEEVPVQSLRDIELTFDSGESEVRHVGHDPSVSIALCQFSNVDWRDVWR